MKDKINKFYLNKLTFIISAVIAIGGWISWSLYMLINAFPDGNLDLEMLKLVIFGIIFALITYLILYAYGKGETNIQKMLIGSLLVFLIVDYVEVFFIFFDENNWFSNLDTLLSIILVITIFICHMIQQSDHSGKSLGSVIGQACGLIFIIRLIDVIYCIIVGSINISDIIFFISVVSSVSFLNCIETRVNKYRQIRLNHRNNNTWGIAEREEAKKIFKID